MIRNAVIVFILTIVVEVLTISEIPTDFNENIKAEDDMSNDLIQFLESSLQWQPTASERLRSLPTRPNLKNLGNNINTCSACRIVVKTSLNILRLRVNPVLAENIARTTVVYFCTSFFGQPQDVCANLYRINWPILSFVLRNTKADEQTLCGMIPNTGCEIKQPEFDWQVKVDEGKTHLNKSKTKESPDTNKADSLTIIQLSDLHYDPEYKNGTMAECKEPLCCRASSSGKILRESQKSGYWGDFRDCDSPYEMIENAFDQIIENHKKIDYIYFTGDIVPHNVWSTTKENVIQIIEDLSKLVRAKFANIPVYPILGNHDTHPVNVFYHKNLPSEFDDSLYSNIMPIWQDLFGHLNSSSSFLHGGYYTISPTPGFRIIAMNNNDCSLLNWWLYLDGGNSSSRLQLQWLHDTLLEAEQAGEYVHILAHIPSAFEDYWPVCAREYQRIIERFSDTITGIFNGHSHYDEFHVHYSKKQYAMAMSWNGGSFSPFLQTNPNYVVYTVAPKTHEVLDYCTWMFNLTEANELGAEISPKWMQTYCFTELTNDLSPAGVDALLDVMAENPNTLEMFWKHKISQADPLLDQGCNKTCLLDTICSLATTVATEKHRCMVLQLKLKNSLK